MLKVPLKTEGLIKNKKTFNRRKCYLVLLKQQDFLRSSGGRHKPENPLYTKNILKDIFTKNPLHRSFLDRRISKRFL